MAETPVAGPWTLDDFLKTAKGKQVTCHLLVGNDREPVDGVLVDFDDNAVFVDLNVKIHDICAVMRHAISYIQIQVPPEVSAGMF